MTKYLAFILCLLIPSFAVADGYAFRVIDNVLVFTADTHTATTGAATDADSPPTYRIYEGETSTPILTGTMALLDDANTTGFYSESITVSAANGFEEGKTYIIRVTATVNSVASAKSHNFYVAGLASETSIVDEMETQMQADPTGFHVNVLEVNGTAQTANDNGADINAILADTGTDGVVLANDAITAAKIAADAIGASEIATDAIGAAEIAANAIGASEIADGAIDAATFATDALSAGALSAAAVTEIQAGLVKLGTAYDYTNNTSMEAENVTISTP